LALVYELRQQTPDEKDEAAETLAGDLESQAPFVRDDVAAIRCTGDISV